MIKLLSKLMSTHPDDFMVMLSGEACEHTVCKKMQDRGMRAAEVMAQHLKRNYFKAIKNRFHGSDKCNLLIYYSLYFLI